MGLRERLNENRGVTVGVIAAVIVVAVGFIVMQVLAGRRTFPTKLPEQYYSVDDGKTFFVANSENLAPFDYKGKVALRAYVFQCPGGKPFVGYLERYTPEARKLKLDKKDTPGTHIYGRELKRPGATTWTKSGDFASVAVLTDLKCPDGKFPDPIEPP